MELFPEDEIVSKTGLILKDMDKKAKLTIPRLKNASKVFCEAMTKENHVELLGVTDGKAVGTYVEHRFQDFLREKYVVAIGNSANGIDLPDPTINTDIKVTSITQPQSSCPFRTAAQKIYGLGYNLLIFVYHKEDKGKKCSLRFTHCAFVDAKRTGDFTLTKRLGEMVKDGANLEDLTAYLKDRNIPGDEITLLQLAERIMKCPPLQGYLTISNALQWRLQYSRVIELDNTVSGIENYVW